MKGGGEIPKRTAAFRFDASAAIGGGHLRRCLTLADALRRDGWRLLGATRAETLAAFPWAKRALDDWVLLTGADTEEAVEIARSAPSCDLLVIDHYERGAAFEHACRSFARAILVIDDMPARDHDCDLLLDPTPRETAPPGAALLTGGLYAPVRPEFVARRPGSIVRRAAHPNVRRVLVAISATDPHDVTTRVLDALDRSGLDVAIDVVLSAAAPAVAAVARRCARMAQPCELHVDTDRVADLMAAADIAIGAAGGGAWERSCLGLPSIALVIADNQRRTAEAIGTSAVVLEGDVSADRLAEAVVALAADAVGRARMSRAAVTMCDGRGAARVAIAVSPERGDRGLAVCLRPACPADRDLLLAWQRHPSTRRFAFNPAAPTAEQHALWFTRRLADPSCLFNVVIADGAPAGVVRLDATAAPGGGTGLAYEVSIVIDPARRGEGLGKSALRLARRLVPEAVLVARIKPENAISLAAFAATGYQLRDRAFVQFPTTLRQRRSA